MRLTLLLGALLVSSVACESEVPAPPKPGETCWPLVKEARGTEYCPVQSCFQQARSFSASVPASEPGFVCRNAPDGLCRKPDAADPARDFAEHKLDLRLDDVEVSLRFSSQLVLDGFSIANFEKHVLGAGAWFLPAPGFNQSGAGTISVQDITFVSYEDNLLHVRFTARASEAVTIITDTPPHQCAYDNGRPFAICTTARCVYGSQDNPRNPGDGSSIEMVVDVTASMPGIEP